MSWSALLLSAGLAGMVLILLARRLRGAGNRSDLTAPRKPKPRRLSRQEVDELTALIGGGQEEAVLRKLRAAGYDEAGSKRLGGHGAAGAGLATASTAAR